MDSLRVILRNKLLTTKSCGRLPRWRVYRVSPEAFGWTVITHPLEVVQNYLYPLGRILSIHKHKALVIVDHNRCFVFHLYNLKIRYAWQISFHPTGLSETENVK